MSPASPTCPSLASLAGGKALSRAVEQLFLAPDAGGVLEILDALLRQAGMRGALSWRPLGDPQRPLSDVGQMALAEDLQSLRVLILAPVDGLSPQLRNELAWLGRLAATRLRHLAETTRLYQAISRLALAERLQRALYAIAEQADSVHDLGDLMHSLHTIVGSLMYAENFFVVLLDRAADTIRFPYYVDAVDPHPPSPTTSLPLETLQNSLTWYLLQSGQPMMGSGEELARSVPGPLVLIGPDCEHWLGVPLIRDGVVVGGLVMQSYRADTQYTQHDRELLIYVAQHVQTALERREARTELERRVTDRTAALREANRILRQQVLQRQRGERLQAALFRIAELANASDGLDTFYVAVHQVIGGLLYARNFYIALLDEDTGELTFPYAVDEFDRSHPPRKHGRGATEYVLRHGAPLLAGPAEFERLCRLGEVERHGTHSTCWLGVPLAWDDKVVGVLGVQSYSPEHTYDQRDQELLTFVSYHIANALQRKQAAESLKQAYASLERRVAERTRALALANRDLREQIAERERVERRLKHETLHDSLTGLPNRTLLLQRMEDALQRHRDDPQQLFAVLFIDLDRFKVINDSVGHLIGDDLLFQVGTRIRAALKTRDVVARLGGDEFAVLLAGIRNLEKATRIAERIIADLQTPFRLGAKEVFTSASIGVALPGPHYRRPEELLRDADAAMYRAKAEGRHRAAVFDEGLRQGALALLEMESDLRRAVERQEFVPYYQPIVALADGDVIGYEALLRWQHPERGVLAPGDFLVVAEESGCVESIDWQIFSQVCRDAGRLVPADGFVSINVSARHFHAPDLDERLLALLDEHGVPPHNIHVEVTEYTLLDHPTHVKRMLENLRQRGVSISLDDFGTGYSSLSYLHQYPFETLKIDRSFITQLPREGESQSLAVVRAIQVLADSLKMKVIAEGIEQEHERQTLLRVGCRYGQGFLFARPQPASVWLGESQPPLAGGAG